LTLSRHNPDALSYVASERFTENRDGIRVLPRSLASVAGFYPADSRLLSLLCAAPLVLAFAGIGFFGMAKKDEFCQLLFVLTWRYWRECSFFTSPLRAI